MTIQQFLSGVNNVIVNPLIFLLFAGALLYFSVAVFRYVKNAENADKKEYKDAVMWGLVGIFIMMGVFGLWRIVLGTFNVNTAPIEEIRRN
jgi:hypothetical protein